MIADTSTVLDKLNRLESQIEDQKVLYQKLLDNQALLLTYLHNVNAFVDDENRRKNELDELKRDVLPIINQMARISIDELSDIGSDFKLEDLLFLFKRLLRDTNLLINLLDRLEATAELVDESQRIARQVFFQVTNSLDILERAGYFKFAHQSWKIVEKVVTEFSEEDIRALGDNIVTILRTIKNLTQPEIMALTNNALSAVVYDPLPQENLSLMSLLKDLSDPKTRKGLSKLLNLIKVLADQPEKPTQ